MASPAAFDAYSPKEIAERVRCASIAKAAMPLLSLVMLGILAGAFIGLGSLFYVIVMSDAALGFAASRVIGGVAFSSWCARKRASRSKGWRSFPGVREGRFADLPE